MRILVDLSSLLLSHDKSIRVTTPGILITLIQGLFSLLASLAFLSANSPECVLIKELIGKVQSGECGKIISETIEKEYGVKVGDDDDEGVIRDALVATGLAKFMEHGAASSRRWILRYSTEVRTFLTFPELRSTPSIPTGLLASTTTSQFYLTVECYSDS